MMLALPAAAIPRASTGTVDREPFGELPDGRAVERFTLRNTRGMEVAFTGWGGAILSIRVPDRHGELADVVLGYATLAEYLRDEVWLGTLIGRYANRIAGARFSLDGADVQLAANNGANALHGGLEGFDCRNWRIIAIDVNLGAAVT